MNRTLIASLALVGLLSAGVANAQTPAPVMTPPTTTPPVTTPATPRVNEIDQRLENQQQRISNGVADGQLTPAQAAKDTAVDNKVATQLSKDEAKHGGHITKAEQNKLNKKLDHNSKRIHHQRKKGEAAMKAAQ